MLLRSVSLVTHALPACTPTEYTIQGGKLFGTFFRSFAETQNFMLLLRTYLYMYLAGFTESVASYIQSAGGFKED